MGQSAKRFDPDNYKPNQVPQAFKVIAGQPSGDEGISLPRQASTAASSGHDSDVDLMTLIQLPAIDLKKTVKFYVEVMGLALDYPERPLEVNSFVSTVPRIGPGLHILQTPASEFRPFELVLYAKSLQVLNGRLREAGVRIVSEPSNGYMSFLDPEGHMIGVYERADSAVNEKFQSNITGFRHMQMFVADVNRTADFFENALGFQRDPSGQSYVRVKEGSENQPLIQLVQVREGAVRSMHWMLDGRPKHALELHSKNIEILREKVIQNGGTMHEELEFTGCGGYLKFYTPDGHYIWVNQDRAYCDY
ncbi:VOC family protein [Paenibacillus alkalitolerans]|uniref:VOC family protein n=1 Tax=Paenibacillus alkalitolerans TaxID=2799335 RepID=UPI0018F6FE90|nr:VOC family protein [Paenibacillus alkalitolerans]